MQQKQKALITGILVVLTTVAVAQSKEFKANSVHRNDSVFMLKPELDETDLLNDEINLQISPESDNQSESILNLVPDLFLSPEIHKESLTFSNSHEQGVLPNLGVTHQYKANVFYQATGNLQLALGGGLLQQNSVLTSWAPNYQMDFSASLEYQLNSWLFAYVNGQYLSPAFNQKGLFDPLQFMSPLFQQNGTESGLRAKFKNVKVDAGVKTINGSMQTETMSSSYFKSKISVGF